MEEKNVGKHIDIVKHSKIISKTSDLKQQQIHDENYDTNFFEKQQIESVIWLWQFLKSSFNSAIYTNKFSFVIYNL